MGLSVSRADLEHASSTVRTGLDAVSANSTALANQINSFVSDSINVLKGSGYDCLRARLLMYEAACEKLNKLCENAANNMINANNKMINETQGYDLNTDALPELKDRITQIERLISWYSELVVVDNSVPEAE